MLLTYVGPHDEVEVEGLGVVARGQDVDVPPELAGRAPSVEQVPRTVLNTAGLAWGRRPEDLTVEHLLQLDPGDVDVDVPYDDELVEVLDPGEGLLAQPDNWQPAKGLEGLKKAELEAIALARGVDLEGTRTKAEIIERLDAADAEPDVLEPQPGAPVAVDPNVDPNAGDGVETQEV